MNKNANKYTLPPSYLDVLNGPERIHVYLCGMVRIKKRSVHQCQFNSVFVVRPLHALIIVRFSSLLQFANVCSVEESRDVVCITF